MDEETLEELYDVAMLLMSGGKGVLAADESNRTIGKRFAEVGIESTETKRRDWRELLLRTKDVLETRISGVILYDETLRQSAADGTPLAKVIDGFGALPGIKVDMGAHPLPGAPGETVTEGLDGLRARLKAYRELGARFTKWRAVIAVSQKLPTETCVRVNAHALARYAALAQEQGMVPIVEPEVLMDGGHSIDRCFEVTDYVLRTVYAELFAQNVALEGTILKPNMVLPGSESTNKADVNEVADKTLRCLRRAVPAAVPGIMFLSGGQSDVDATAHLNAVAGADTPWPVSFSYGRALQQAALKTWRGEPANVEDAQEAFGHRAEMNGRAAEGAWSMDLEAA